MVEQWIYYRVHRIRFQMQVSSAIALKAPISKTSKLDPEISSYFASWHCAKPYAAQVHWLSNCWENFNERHWSYLRSMRPVDKELAALVDPDPEI